MTQQDKLLLKDLCARLPYSVMAYAPEINKNGIITDVNISYNMVNLTVDNASGKYELVPLFDIKPYLRPMSSMTNEERSEWADLFNLELDKLNEISDENKAEELAPYYFGKCHQVSIDWLNKKMFDYRGLIPMGLAIESSKRMYKTK